MNFIRSLFSSTTELQEPMLYHQPTELQNIGSSIQLSKPIPRLLFISLELKILRLEKDYHQLSEPNEKLYQRIIGLKQMLYGSYSV